MTIMIYNTLTREKEPFQPIDKNEVKMYVCGPTVYNYIHIGNARPAIVFDTVRRYFEYQGYDVKYVLNFTDIDDKIINVAREQGISVSEVTEKYIHAYLKDVDALRVKRATYHPRVTETISEIIAFIKGLLEKGYAYEVDGDVYFKARHFEDYGKLSAQSIDELRAGARIQVGERKEDPLDFVLWKKVEDDEVSWDSPWGKGRPGWHIECSAMAKKYLGETIDIHAGGQDLSFPHHENEIAQSEALNDQTFANYWMHNGHMNIDDEKMSKSLGNFILTKDLIEKHDPNIIRFFMLSVHYRSPINFTDELLNSAKNSFQRIEIAYQNLEHRKQSSLNIATDEKVWLEKIKTYKYQFEEAMNDDFNTAKAIAALFDLTREANMYLEEKQTSTTVIEAFQTQMKTLLDVLGLTLDVDQELLDDDIESLLKEREEARKNRNFERADEIRDLLRKQNIILEDTPQGVRWRRG